MVDELKTLNDLCNKIEGTKEALSCAWLPVSDIRYEAIKWIKEIDNASGNTDFQDDNLQLQDWIKHFFNITDEDLKS